MKQLHLWQISQHETTGDGTYTSAVVVAATAREASLIHPADNTYWIKRDGLWEVEGDNFSQWARDLENIRVEYLGIAATTLRTGLVLAALN